MRTLGGKGIIGRRLSTGPDSIALRDQVTQFRTKADADLASSLRGELRIGISSAIRLARQSCYFPADQIVPYVASGPLSAKLLKNGTYKDFPARHARALRAFSGEGKSAPQRIEKTNPKRCIANIGSQRNAEHRNR